MKKVYCPFLMFSVLLLNGCSIQDHTAVPEEKAKTEVSAATESEEEQDETKSETYLELISFENHSPYYTIHVTFKKLMVKRARFPFLSTDRIQRIPRL